jgi:hypothetical protein
VRRVRPKTSATAGSIFHRSHTPLSTWCAAVSAQKLEDALGFGSHETASAWLHTLRRAMVHPERKLLSGVIELDQSFVGGRATGERGPSRDKAPITIAVERDDRGRLGRVRQELADKPGGLDLTDFVCHVVARGATICTDGARMFTRLSGKRYAHQPPPGTPPTISMRLCRPHLASSPFKRWTAGTLHYRISPRHLPYYLDEFTFRISRRTSKGQGHVVLPTAPAGRGHRPSSAQGPDRRLSKHCTQAEMHALRPGLSAPTAQPRPVAGPGPDRQPATARY